MPSLECLPSVPDLVLVATPALAALAVVEQCASLGVRAVTVFGSGFAESGDEGAALQDRLRDASLAGGIALCGPNCYGVANLLDNVAASSIPLPPGLEPGGLAFVLQSGALSHGLIDFAVRRQLGVAYLMTTGNEAVLDVADYLRAVAADRRVKSVAAYVEAIRQPQAFLLALEHLAEVGISVSILRSGRSELGLRATQAHTGAVASDDRIWTAMLRSAGAVQVEDISELAEAAAFALDRPSAIGGGGSLQGDAPFLMSLSGAASSIMADLAEQVSLDLCQPDDALKSAIRRVLPEATAVQNPLDLTGYVADAPERIGSVAFALDTTGSGLLPTLVLNSPSATTEADRVLYHSAVRGLVRPEQDLSVGSDADSSDHRADDGYLRQISSRAVGTMLPGDIDQELLLACRSRGYPVVAGIRTLTTILAARSDAARGRADWSRAASQPRDEEVSHQVQSWLAGVDEGASRANRTLPIGEGAAKELLRRAGLRTPRRIEVHDSHSATIAATEVGFPVVVKVDDPEIPHKARAGCVVIGLYDATAVAAAVGRVAQSASAVIGARSARSIVVEEQFSEGADLFVGALRSGDLDAVIVAGVGGVAVEAGLGGVALRVPADREACARLLRTSALGKVVAAAGGRPGEALRVFGEVLYTVSQVADALGDALVAMDLNPVRLLSPRSPEDGVEAVVLDALVELTSGVLHPLGRPA